MGEITVQGSELGNALTEMLMAPEIIPGDQPSYEICKTLWIYHPLGKKMVESPIEMAQCQEREISVPASPESRCVAAFRKEWETIGADDKILNVMSTSRAYGIASIALMAQDVPANQPVDPKAYWKLQLSFNILDPLNTAGSLVLNQDPNSIDFQKVVGVSVGGVPYHRSRTVTMMHERPVYIAYTSSAFGFVGRSVFQRALFPLKSFIQTMVTDDLVVKKAGVFIAKLKAAGAIINNVMQRMAGLKRLFVKEATNGNVISIGTEEEIETLNMQNVDKAFGMARKNILENIAVSADMPAEFLNSETFAEGFADGTEDAKRVAQYVGRVRRQMRPLYAFFDGIVMRRAWNPDFYKIIQEEFPDYRSIPYEQAFYKWSNSFTAEWPNLLTEPDSEKVKTDDVKLKAIIATVEVFGPMMDPENKATLLMWAQDNINENKLMFTDPMVLDFEALRTYVPPQPMVEPGEPKPFSAADAAESIRTGKGAPHGRRRHLTNAELLDLVDMMQKADPQGLPPPEATRMLTGPRIAA